MKAVNLIPSDQRRGGTSSGSGLGSYILIAVLAVVVFAGAAYTLTNRSISDKRHELADVQARAAAAANEAEALKAYTSFSALSQKRSETIRSLATSRFDWSHALHEVARTIPSNAWLTGLRGTVTPASSVQGGNSDPLRGAIEAPAIEVAGCTTSQDNVAKVVSSLRRADGVQRVSLSSTEKLTVGNGAGKSDSAAGAGGADDCRQGDAHFAKFSLTLFFTAPTPSTTSTQTQGTTP
jgi:Tfp pilus assembly protein PilN